MDTRFRVAPLALALVALGCAAPEPALTPHHPAHATASPQEVAAAPLDPVRQPDLPAPLRPDAQPAGAGMDHAGHAGMRMDDPGARPDAVPPGPVPDGLGAVLDAYLTIQAALAGDTIEGVPAAAQTLGAAVETMTATPPEGQPHFWHERMAETATLQVQARALASAEDLASARLAFGAFSGAFVPLVEGTGVPEGFEIARFTCGMFSQSPEGGLWLQRDGATRNPYFGSAMLTCGTRDGAVPEAGHGAHDRMDPGAMGHDGR